MKKSINKRQGARGLLEEQVHAAGGRVTRSRKAVLAVLGEAEAPLPPEGIRQRALAICPTIGLVTVYRALSLLIELGQARRLHLPDGSHAYVRSTLDHGHHLICRRCQVAVEVPGSEDLSPWLRRVAARTGFRIDDHELALVGVCPECQESASGVVPATPRSEVGP